MSVRGEPKTPPSVVSPPWKRDNPHTPTYRPPHPHYENLPAANRHSAPQFDSGALSGGETPPPPRPEKLTPRHSASNANPQESVRQSHSYSLDPQKWRDELQAKTNTLKRVDDPLIFQFPVPYRQPYWLQVLQLVYGLSFVYCPR